MKVLFIAGHEFLYNPQNGGQKCSLRNYRLIQSIFKKENVYLCMFSNYSYNNLDANVTIFPTHKNLFELVTNTLFFRNVCNKTIQKKVINYIVKMNFDMIFVDSTTIGYLISKTKFKKSIVVFFHNIEKLYAWNKVKHEGILNIIPFLSYSINEKTIAKYADKLIFLNDRDNLLAEKIYNRKADYILPITFKDEFDETKILKNINKNIKTLLFVGSLFTPNYKGIIWFIEKVFTKLTNKYELIIIGKNFESKRNELERDRVKVIGTVNDLSQYYYNADAVVIPTFYGNGMKVKTAEAMMYGKAIFATHEALEGYIYEKEYGIYECNTEEEFLENISEFFEYRKNTKYIQNIRDLFLLKYSDDSVNETFKKFMNGIE